MSQFIDHDPKPILAKIIKNMYRVKLIKLSMRRITTVCFIIPYRFQVYTYTGKRIGIQRLVVSKSDRAFHEKDTHSHLCPQG